MGNPILKLRGHHVALFAEEFFEDRDAYLSNVKKIYVEDDEFRKLDLNSEHTDLSYQQELIRMWDSIVVVYGPDMRDTVDLYWYMIKEFPDMEIEIVEGLDSICLANCPRVDFHCFPILDDEMDEDQAILLEYGLKVGETYTAGQLVEAVLDYTRHTGLRSPRDSINWPYSHTTIPV